MLPDNYRLKNKKIFVAGHNGMVGSAILRLFQSQGLHCLSAERSECDFTDVIKVNEWFEKMRPDAVVIAAAKVGGIHANDKYPVDFLLENLKIQNNLIEAAFTHQVEKLLFLGSSCIYPKDCPQPINEDSLLDGKLEETNQWYAIAKISGLKLCQAYRKQHGADFVSLMPTNLYGPNDNFHPQNSHVPAALLRRFHEAKISNLDEVTVWGSGIARREFLHVDDLAMAVLHILKNYSGYNPINVGTGVDISIKSFAELVAQIVGFEGLICFDESKPDGTLQKRLDIKKVNELGWRPKIDLLTGMSSVYRWTLENKIFDPCHGKSKGSFT